MRFGKWAYVLGAVVAVGFFGAGNVLMKVAYEGMGPLWCAAMRFGSAAALLGVLFGRRTVRSLRAVPVSCWLPPTLCMAASFLTAALSVNYATATTAGFFFALPLLFAPGLAYVLSGKRVGKGTIAIQLVVIFGLYLLCCNGGTPSFGFGEALGLLSAAAYAGALVTGEKCMQEVDAISLTVSQIAASAGFALVLAVAFEQPPALADVPAVSWGAVLLLGLLSTCLAFLLQNVTLEKVSSTTTSVIVCAEPLFTALLAMAFLGETLSTVGLAGGAVILTCTVVAALPERTLRSAVAHLRHPALARS